ncbi:MAG: YqeG family HAD IIIA-type phosphatase [Lachnospiraceae bacterium]|nr:YqeG family HAD IIIA-type phosphatase [Lachnospiraceae bacterium]
MLEKFYPDCEVESVYSINFEALYKAGYRGVIFDIDNTLVPHGAPATDEAVAFFEKLKKLGMATMLLSNNKEPRVKSFADAVKSPYIYKGGKPAKNGYEKAMKRMGTTVSDTIFVGDQLFTDVWGAKRMGIRNFLVKPIHPKEEIQIVLKRRLEKVVLNSYHKEGVSKCGK